MTEHAATELEELGRQITLERRAEIMSRVARAGAGDVVRPLAKSNFGRRTPEQLLLVESLTAIGTAEARFALNRLSEFSSSGEVRAAAASAPSDFGGGPCAALFSLLAVAPHAQRETWSDLGDDARRQVAAQLEAVLAELDREKGATANPYLRTLLRAVIRLPLVVWEGGELENRAAQRFGQLSSHLGAEELETLLLMRPERSLELLRAALTSGDAGRLALALRALPQLSTSDDLRALARRWIEHPTNDVATLAAKALLAPNFPNDAADARRIVRRAERADDTNRNAMLGAVLGAASAIPEIRLKWFADSKARRHFVGLAVAREAEGAALQVHLRAEALEDHDPRLLPDLASALRVLSARGTDDCARVILQAVYVGIAADGRRRRTYRTALRAIARDENLRASLWHGLASLPRDTAGAQVLKDAAIALAVSEPPPARPPRLATLLSATPDASAISATVNLVHDGSVAGAEMAIAMPNALVTVALSASRDAAQTDRLLLERDDAATESHHGNERNRFLETVRPSVERAMQDSRGNERLRFQYERLTEGFAQVQARATESDRVPSKPVTSAGPTDLRAYLKLSSKRSGPDVRDERRALARELGRAGSAADAIRQLYEGGPDQRRIARLAGEALDDLLDAALENALAPPSEWLSHPQYGSWLARRMLASDPTDVVDQTGDARALLAVAFDEGAHIRRRLNAQRDTSKERRSAAQTAIAGTVASVLEELDLLVLGYARVRKALGHMGWESVAELGSSVEQSAVDPLRHRIIGEPSPRYFVRAAGVEIDGRVVIPAVLEREAE